MKTEEQVKKAYICEFCGERFSSESEAASHEEDHRIEEEFKKSHKPNVSIEDIVEYDRSIYKVIGIKSIVEKVFTDKLLKRAKYIYELKRTYTTEKHCRSTMVFVSDYCNGNAEVKKVLSADEGKVLYRDLQAVCDARSKLSIEEFVNAVNA